MKVTLEKSNSNTYLVVIYNDENQILDLTEFENIHTAYKHALDMKEAYDAELVDVIGFGIVMKRLEAVQDRYPNKDLMTFAGTCDTMEEIQQHVANWDK